MNQVKEDNFLGVILDETLSWKPHISQVASKVSKSVGVIRKSSFRLTKTALCTLYYSRVCSYLKRCEIPFNGTLSPLPLFSVVPLALRFVGTRRRPNNVKGGGLGGTLSQVSSKHLFLGKCLNNFVANCRSEKKLYEPYEHKWTTQHDKDI